MAHILSNLPLLGMGATSRLSPTSLQAWCPACPLVPLSQVLLHLAYPSMPVLAEQRLLTRQGRGADEWPGV